MKLPDLPPAVARAFVEDARAFYAENDMHKRVEIAARQRHILAQYLPQRARLRLSEVKELFRQLRDQI